MNIAQTAEVLAAVQLYDARKIDEATIKAWHRMLADYSLSDCLAAIEEHFKTSTDWMLPAHIIRRVKSVRARRLQLAGSPVLSPADELDADGRQLPDWKQKQDALRSLIANGDVSPAEYQQYQAGGLTLTDLMGKRQQIEAQRGQP